MSLSEIDEFCNSCKNFDRILKGKAMTGFCLRHNQIVSGRKQFIRIIFPFFDTELGRTVIERRIKFNLNKDCYEKRGVKTK